MRRIIRKKAYDTERSRYITTLKLVGLTHILYQKTDGEYFVEIPDLNKIFRFRDDSRCTGCVKCPAIDRCWHDYPLPVASYWANNFGDEVFQLLDKVFHFGKTEAGDEG